MNPTLPFPVRHYDPLDDLTVVERRLPHWLQEGAIAFITWRTWDSMPTPVLVRFAADRDAWLRDRSIDPATPGWEHRLCNSPADPCLPQAYRGYCFTRWESDLNRGHGSCPLRHPLASAVVADSLRHFDGERYVLFDFVVMPNHVHVSAAFPEAGVMRKQCTSWKHFTAKRLNEILGRSGRFWPEESFDHLTRSDDQFEYLRDYIARNPAQAGLRSGEYDHYSRSLVVSPARVASARPLAERAGHSHE